MDAMDAAHDRLDPEAITRAFHLLDGRARDEFVDGIAKRLGRLDVAEGAEVAEARRDLLRWVRSWLVSTALERDEEWQHQMAESRERIERGDVGNPIGVDELRGLLTR